MNIFQIQRYMPKGFQSVMNVTSNFLKTHFFIITLILNIVNYCFKSLICDDFNIVGKNGNVQIIWHCHCISSTNTKVM